MPVSRNGNYLTVRPAGPPKTRAGKVFVIARFIEERIASAGNVTEDALRQAGFALDEVTEFMPDVRKQLEARGIGGFAG